MMILTGEALATAAGVEGFFGAGASSSEDSSELLSFLPLAASFTGDGFRCC